MGLSTGSGTVRSPMSERGLDFYRTPPEAVHALLDNFPIPQVIHESSCGDGVIVDILRATGRTVYASDIVDRECPGSFVEDFLKRNKPIPGVECCLTNPPFFLAEEFVHHALYILRIPKVIMLLRLAFLEGGNLNNNKGRCRKQVLDGGHLAQILLFRRRLPFMHRENFTGRRSSNSAMPFMWGCWDLQHNGSAQFKRISWFKNQ